MKFNRVRQGFTLVEILIAISIIVILMAILFPVFGQCITKAKTVVCVSNMSQISKAMVMYTQDFDETYPPMQIWRDTNDSHTREVWVQWLAPYEGNSTSKFGLGGLNHCPNYADSNPLGNSYSANWWILPDWHVGYPSAYSHQVISTFTVSAPSSKALLFEHGYQKTDETDWSYGGFPYEEEYWTDAFYAPGKDCNNDIAAPSGLWPDGHYKHGCGVYPRIYCNTTNVAFCDGHVKAFPKDAIYSGSGKTMSHNLWEELISKK